MPEVTVKVTIPHGYELACDHVRPVECGESSLDFTGDGQGQFCGGHRGILKKV